ncbi:MAG: sialate O-acetylesterase, partial [Bryocella sp.]
EMVTVSLHDQNASVSANDLGTWSLWLLPEDAGGPYTLKVKGSSAVTVTDLYMGDVWVASGQSNMSMPLKGFPTAVIKDSALEIRNANQPNIRLLHVTVRPSDYPRNDIADRWTLCTPATAADFSAVAYFFGRDISSQEHVKVGLIDASMGGTLAESWISLQGIATMSDVSSLLIAHAHATGDIDEGPQIMEWEKRMAAAGHPVRAKKYRPNEKLSLSALYNGMIAPLISYPIKGVIWYQGENDASPERAPLYDKLFAALIQDWRAKWSQGNFPFLFAQLSSFEIARPGWAEVRDAQRRTLNIANTGLAVTLDLGIPKNVHYANKQAVGTRLALAARAIAYGEQLEYSGPLFRQSTQEGHSLRLWFDHAKDMRASSGTLRGFEVAAADGTFVPATARIDHGSVVVSADSVAAPVTVRYGGADVSDANLVNGAGLPAATFISR